MSTGSAILLPLLWTLTYNILLDAFSINRRYSQNTIRRPSIAIGRRSQPQMSADTNTDTHHFTKMHGLGNDFILVDNMKSNEPIYTPAQAIKICNRNFGIGGDGLIFAMPGTNNCDYTMRIYNSDGSEPEMCGNGIRCMAKFIQQKIDTKTNNDPNSGTADSSYSIWTGAGVIGPVIKDGLVTVDMGTPILNPSDVPSLLPVTQNGAAVDADISIEGHSYKVTAVSMGNPHSIIFVEDLDSMDPPFSVIGPLAEKSPVFPEKVNTEFVQVLSRTHLKMKVWERGAGPTLACGTGACAVVVAAVLTGRSERSCTVTLPGGDLLINWDAGTNKVFMTGPAETVCEGVINASLLSN